MQNIVKRHIADKEVETALSMSNTHADAYRNGLEFVENPEELQRFLKQLRAANLSHTSSEANEQIAVSSAASAAAAPPRQGENTASLAAPAPRRKIHPILGYTADPISTPPAATTEDSRSIRYSILVENDKIEDVNLQIRQPSPQLDLEFTEL